MIIVISGGLIWAAGLGWLVVGPLLHGGQWRSRQEGVPLLQELALSLVWGLIVDYGIVVLLQSLYVSLIVGGLLALFGLGCFGIYVFRSPELRPKLYSALRNKWIGIVLVGLLYVAPILSQPLSAWDARVIWFLHARMIYLAGSFGESAGWLHPSVSWSHLDYPNLVPVLAAQAAFAKGYWNEYLPKASLVFVLAPALIWLFTFARPSMGFALLLMLLPFSLGEWLWNGYMDGYLALYFSIAMLLFGRYRLTSQTIDLISCISCLTLLLYFKNEGILAALAGLGAMLVTSMMSDGRPRFQFKEALARHRSSGLAGLVGLIPFSLWSLDKQRWNLTNDLQIGAAGSLSRMFGRLADGSYWLILQRSYNQIAGALLLFGFLCLVVAFNKKLAIRESLPALIAAGAYAAAMVAIYLLTPYDLAWHLDTSIERTMLLVRGSLYAASFFVLNRLDNHQDERASQSSITAKAPERA